MSTTGSKEIEVLVATYPKATTKDKGDLLEKLAKSILDIRGFEVNEEIRKDGAELDLLCVDKINRSKSIYVECKAYNREKKISAETIYKMKGICVSQKYDDAWLMATSSFTKDAKEVVDKDKGSGEKQYTYITPEHIIDMLFVQF